VALKGGLCLVVAVDVDESGEWECRELRATGVI
jgi:hypothetical protein